MIDSKEIDIAHRSCEHVNPPSYKPVSVSMQVNWNNKCPENVPKDYNPSSNNTFLRDKTSSNGKVRKPIKFIKLSKHISKVGKAVNYWSINMLVFMIRKPRKTRMKSNKRVCCIKGSVKF